MSYRAQHRKYREQFSDYYWSQSAFEAARAFVKSG
jgi:hypothetical protein